MCCSWLLLRVPVGCGHCRSCLGISSNWELHYGQVTHPQPWLPEGYWDLCPYLCSALQQRHSSTSWLLNWVPVSAILVVSSSKQLWVCHIPLCSSLLSQTSSSKSLLQTQCCSLPPSSISVLSTCMIMSEFSAVNSNFHVKCLFFTHQMNVCNFRVFLALVLFGLCVFLGRQTFFLKFLK